MCKGAYSPRIKEEYISELYKMKEIFKKPMTEHVNLAVAEYLKKYESILMEYDEIHRTQINR